MSELTRAHTIISYYQSKYKERYGTNTVVNRNKIQYQVSNILKDLTMKQTKELIDFYLATDKHPRMSVFCYEYDEILDRMNREAKDLETRKSLLANTQKTVEQFRRRYGAD